MSDDRGVAHVLGVILMAGFAITVAATVAVAGASMFADSQSQIETSQVESSFSSLAADASELEDGESVEFDLGTADGQLEVRDDTGHLKIYHEKGEDTIDVYEENINSLEYTTEDGDVVGYQASGVFRQHGSGSSVVSAPDFFYRDNALSFPIQKVDGDIQSSGTLSGELALEREQRHYPDPEEDKLNPLEGGTVYVEMESEYCQGWEEYFSQQTRGSISEGCDEEDDGMVQVELSVPFEIGEGTIDSPAKVGSGGYEGSNNDMFVDEDVDEDGNSLPSATSLVETMESDFDNEEDDHYELPDEGPVEESGLYYSDGPIENEEEYIFDTAKAGGDIEVYVGGDFAPDGDIKVKGPHDVVFFLEGNLDVDTSNVDYIGHEDIGGDGQASQTQFFIHSDYWVGSDPDTSHSTNVEIHSLIYAPESVASFGGSADINGALIVDELDTQNASGNKEFTHDEGEWETFEASYSGAGPEFYYLHVTERTVTASG